MDRISWLISSSEIFSAANLAAIYMQRLNSLQSNFIPILMDEIKIRRFKVMYLLKNCYLSLCCTISLAIPLRILSTTRNFDPFNFRLLYFYSFAISCKPNSIFCMEILVYQLFIARHGYLALLRSV